MVSLIISIVSSHLTTNSQPCAPHPFPRTDQATGAIFSGADSLLPPLAKASTLTGMAALLGALFLSVAGTLAL